MLQFSVLLESKESNFNYFKTTGHLFYLLSTFGLGKRLKWDWACLGFISCSIIFRIELNFLMKEKLLAVRFQMRPKILTWKIYFLISLSQFQTLASCNLLGVIEGSNSEKERIRSAKETSQRPVAGTEQKHYIDRCIFVINKSDLDIFWTYRSLLHRHSLSVMQSSFYCLTSPKGICEEC